ncbi:hypothetical protein TTHERM_000379048 (macronuclear) [Tetrahymena thermophila SB210]|uniref:Kinase domain protein n=1 Tax=Tetrahymena thermophila (strain SB210) TaxID=312017 RepID=W7XK04_TETTS|nr:hypothetical protein TTHERM_000379048 [Tetrahymena thermophila SB210]EWS74484.1 hypothetical protein TTHERM_000379048 [Tetrahymena thermophila SB210]|eukprot:XP_012652969.1 hypothetical protein TTHERM_000379048 [Tetrahymena thermophila SB210]
MYFNVIYILISYRRNQNQNQYIKSSKHIFCKQFQNNNQIKNILTDKQMEEEDFDQTEEFKEQIKFKFVESLYTKSSYLPSIEKNNQNQINDSQSQSQMSPKFKDDEEFKEKLNQIIDQQQISEFFGSQEHNLDSSSSKFSSINVFYLELFKIQGDLNQLINFIPKEDENKYKWFSQFFLKLLLSKDEQFQEQQINSQILNLITDVKTIFQNNLREIIQFELDFISYKYLDGQCLSNIIKIYDNAKFNKIEILTLKLRGEFQSKEFQEIIQPLSSFGEMQSLSLQLLQFDKIREKDIAQLVTVCKNMKNLKSFKLNLHDCKNLDDEAINHLSKWFQQLQKLEEIQIVLMYENRFTNEGISKLLQNINLKILDLRLAQLNQNIGNYDYNANNYEQSQIQKICEKIIALKNLVHFKLVVRERDNITDVSIKRICSKLKQLDYLKVLNLQFRFVQCFTDKSLTRIRRIIYSKYNQLEEIVLDFSFSKFSSNEINKFIHSLQNQKQLRKLKLDFDSSEVNEIGNQIIIALSLQIENMEFLTSLSLNFNNILIIGYEIEPLVSALASKQYLRKLRLFFKKIVIEQKRESIQIIKQILNKTQCELDFGQGPY